MNQPHLLRPLRVLRATLLLFSVFCLLSSAAPAQTVNVTWNYADFTVAPQKIRQVNITPVFQVTVSGTNLVTADTRTFVTGLTGSLVVSNVLTGYGYQVDFLGPTRVTTITNFFSTDESGDVDASTNLISTNSIPGGNGNYLSQAQSDARYLARDSGAGTTPTFTNFVTVVDDTGDSNIISGQDGFIAQNPEIGTNSLTATNLTINGISLQGTPDGSEFRTVWSNGSIVTDLNGNNQGQYKVNNPSDGSGLLTLRQSQSDGNFTNVIGDLDSGNVQLLTTSTSPTGESLVRLSGAGRVIESYMTNNNNSVPFTMTQELEMGYNNVIFRGTCDGALSPNPLTGRYGQNIWGATESSQRIMEVDEPELDARWGIWIGAAGGLIAYNDYYKINPDSSRTFLTATNDTTNLVFNATFYDMASRKPSLNLTNILGTNIAGAIIRIDAPGGILNAGGERASGSFTSTNASVQSVLSSNALATTYLSTSGTNIFTLATTGWTNRTGYNAVVYNFTGTGVFQTNQASHQAFTWGTIAAPIAIPLNTNEALVGTSCAGNPQSL